jgi:hypothetical protein
MLMFEHGRRHMQEIAWPPRLVAALNFAVSLSFENVDQCFQVLVPAAVMIGRVFKNERHGDAGGLEAVRRDDEEARDIVLLLNGGEVALLMI